MKNKITKLLDDLHYPYTEIYIIIFIIACILSTVISMFDGASILQSIATISTIIASTVTCVSAVLAFHIYKSWQRSKTKNYLDDLFLGQIDVCWKVDQYIIQRKAVLEKEILEKEALLDFKHLANYEEQIQFRFQANKLNYFLARSGYIDIAEEVQKITDSFTDELIKSNESIKTSYNPLPFNLCTKYCDQLLELKNKI